MVLPQAEVSAVWERHPVEGVAEQPIHFVRRRTELRKEVGALGLEDSKEWHRDHAQVMGGECYDRAVLVECKQHYTDLMEHFPSMKHYWEDPEATFGEQLVLDGVDADSICVGDELQSEYGPLRLKVTCPRLCCFRVDHRYPAIPPIKRSGTPGTVRQWCSSNGRGGFMCRVVHPGTVMAGDKFKVEKRPHPKYPISRLAGMVYGKTPIHVDFNGNDDELQELCNMEEDLCHYEWLDALVHYKDSVMQKRPLQVHESLGSPVPYEEGVKLTEGLWFTQGGLEAARDGAYMQREAKVSWDGDNLVVEPSVFAGVPFQLKPRNDHGHFAVEADLGGFPNFPRFAYMTRMSDVSGAVNLVFSNGTKWFKEPNA
eukprot:TRINITY_DN2394_c0_g2_i1.p1 TRINITY_DN2394_c0_g2~~TRINITY_DN2394_c0_g2_i1.p1  ORF type:complete len:370 (+),score=60.90 TRINITY_DN2394_c0_g2_i1:88-1197(+)